MAKTLTEIRRDVGHDTCADVRRIAGMFRTLVREHPDVAKKILPALIRRDTDAKQELMVQHYDTMAEYLLEVFNNQ